MNVGSTEISPLGFGVSLMTRSPDGSAADTLAAAPSARRSATAVDAMMDRFTMSPNVLVAYPVAGAGWLP
jgi:hypothetical protein